MWELSLSQQLLSVCLCHQVSRDAIRLGSAVQILWSSPDLAHLTGGVTLPVG